MPAWVRPAVPRPATLRETVLAAGAACALGSLALLGAQLAQPEESGFVDASASLAASVGATFAPISPGMARVDRRIEALRARLLIEPGAAPPEWERVAAVLRGDVHLVDEAVARRREPAMKAVRARAELDGSRVQALRDLLAALRPLYQVMTPQQRRAADRVLRVGLRPGGTPG